MTDAQPSASDLSWFQRTAAWASPFRALPEEWVHQYERMRALKEWTELVRQQVWSLVWVGVGGLATVVAGSMGPIWLTIGLALVMSERLWSLGRGVRRMQAHWKELEKEVIERAIGRGCTHELVKRMPRYPQHIQRWLREMMWRFPENQMQDFHQLISLCLAAGAKLNERDDFWGGTPLELASSIEKVQVLLAHGARPDNPSSSALLKRGMASQGFASRWLRGLWDSERAVMEKQPDAAGHCEAAHRFAIATLDVWLSYGWEMPDRFLINGFGLGRSRYNYTQETMLTAAFEFGIIPVVLLERGANPELRNEAGQSFVDLLDHAERTLGPPPSCPSALGTPPPGFQQACEAYQAKANRLRQLREALNERLSLPLLRAIEAEHPQSPPAARHRL